MKKPAAIWFILVTILIDAIGVGIVFPLMPSLMERVGASDAGTGAVWGGVLMSAYAATQFLFAPAIGGLSDALGRKPILLIALITLAVDYAIMALAGSYWILLVGRLLAGIAGATYITATAYLADISSPEEKAANFGLIGATFGVGFVLGPAIGGLLAGISISAPFWFAGALAAVNVVFGLFILPESLPPEKRRPLSAITFNPFGALRHMFAVPALALPLGALLTFEFANMVYPTLWAFWGRAMFDWSELVIGASLAAYGVGVAITQAAILPMLLKRLGEYRVLNIGLIAGIVAAGAFGIVAQPWIVAFLIFLSCLSDMTPPTLTALMSNQTDEDQQGLLQGVIGSLSSLAAIGGPLIMTPLFRAFAGEQSRVALPGAPFLLASVLMLAVLFVVRDLRPRALQT